MPISEGTISMTVNATVRSIPLVSITKTLSFCRALPILSVLSSTDYQRCFTKMTILVLKKILLTI